MERINILWTGGFDSTFRVCQLSLLEVEIQPFYISLKRESEPYELKAMSDITDYISSNKASKCSLLPVKIIDYDEILPDEEVTNSFKTLEEEFGIGYQYDFLTRFARQYDLMPEIGFERSPFSPEDKCFSKYKAIKNSEKHISGGATIKYCELDPDQSSEDLVNVFGHFRFGLPLFNLNKIQALEAYKDIGYEQVIPLTWFCAHPINGKPCGLCSPCETVMKAKMSFRLPLRARILYKLFKSNPVGRLVDLKLKTLYNKHWRNTEVENETYQ